ncbi:MAG: hypothetical protein ACLPPF_05905 [Rhodomicrobium sp.]
MLLREANSKVSRSKRAGQLLSRLQVLTQDYAPFFAGFVTGSGNDPGRQSYQTPQMLTDLQQLRRVQLASVAARLAGSDDDPVPIR